MEKNDVLKEAFIDIIDKRGDLTEDEKLLKIETLIDLGLDINEKINGYSLWSLCASRDLKKIAQYFKERECEISKDELTSRLCSMCTISYLSDKVSDEEILSEMKALIDAGADVNGDDSSGNPLMQICDRHIERNNPNYFYDEETGEDNGEYPYIVADELRLKMIKLLLENGADATYIDDYGASALMCAQDREARLLLIEHGADIEDIARPYKRELMIAECHQNKSSYYTRMYSKDEYCVNLADENGNYPLHYAICNGKEKLVEILLDGGANVNLYSSNDCLPLDHAFIEGNLEIAKMLLEKNAKSAYLNGDCEIDELSNDVKDFIKSYRKAEKHFTSKHKNEWKMDMLEAKSNKERRGIINKVKKKMAKVIKKDDMEM